MREAGIMTSDQVPHGLVVLADTEGAGRSEG